MRKRSAIAALAAIALAGFGLLSTAAPAFAAGQGNPPTSTPMYWSANAGQSDLSIHDTGHTSQATIATGINELEAVDDDTIGGITYFQIEDATSGLCLNDGNAPAIKWESCPVDNAGEQVSLAGTNGNEIKFKNDSEYLTASGLASGDTLSVSSTATPSAENQFLYTNPDPADQTLPVDFTASGASSGDWGTLATDSQEPAAEIHSAVFEVCDAKGDCGGNQSENDTDWDTPLTTMQNAGMIPLYYISTNYGATSLTALEASISDAEGWYGTYGIGFMFDEVQANGADNCQETATVTESCQTYYQTLEDYIAGPTADGDLNLATVTMLNPGTPPTDNYFGSYTTHGYELIQVFENDISDLAGLVIPAWMSGIPAHEFVATVSGITGATGADGYQGAISTLQSDGIANSYMVPDYLSGPNEGQPNYTQLPSWLNAEELYAASYDPGLGWGEN